MNGTLVKNELIFDFACGSLGLSKSIFVSTYLYLNSRASKINTTFEKMLGDSLIGNKDTAISTLKFSDCFKTEKKITSFSANQFGPLSKAIGPFNKIKWKQVFKGLSEYSTNINGDDDLKLIKMDPGSSVPLHSHGGKEYILVLSGSFCDEYGKYSKGDIQINDQKIKHTPIACNKEGCICLTITEKNVIFFGRYASFFNLFTFIRSFFK